MEKPQPTHFREPTVCDLLGINRSTLWRWVREGRFPEPRDLGGGMKRWHVDDIAEWRRASTPDWFHPASVVNHDDNSPHPAG